MFDSTTFAAYAAAATPLARAQAVRDSLGSGTLTVLLKRSGSTQYSGTFAGPLVAEADGSITADAVLSGAQTTTFTPTIATDTLTIQNAAGTRTITGTFGPGGRFTSVRGDLVAGTGLRLNIAITAPTELLPTWRAGQSVNAWREISGSSLSLCPPTNNYGDRPLASRMNAWCGLALDTRSSTIWSCGNGGHDDWWGNDVYKIDLRSNAPAWVEVLAATTGYTIPNNNARYSDGSPASAHTYYSQQFIEARNRAIRFGIGAVSTSGNPQPAMDGFNPVLKQWEVEGTYPSWPDFYPDQPVCKNTGTEDVFLFLNNNVVYKWTQSANTVATVNSSPPDTMIKAASCFDPVRGRIFLANSRGAWTYDVSTNTFTARTLTGAGASIKQDAQGCVYEPTLDAYVSLIANSGAIKVYVTDPVTFAVSALSTTGTDPTIDIGGNGGGNPYGKWHYDPFLAGVVGFTNHAENAFFLRTH